MPLLQQPLLLQSPLPRILVLKVAMSRSTFSNKLPKLPKLVVPHAVELQAELEVCLELLEVAQVRVVLALDWATSISCEITHNSNNFDKSSNKTLKCSNRSFNKLELVIHS
jgi:hypothetical protein